MLRKGSKLAARTVAKRTGRVDWSNCLTAYTPKTLRDHFTALDGRVARAKNIVNSAPKEIPTIDWAGYEAKGVEPEVIAKMKAAYEAKKFGEPTMGSEWKSIESFISFFKSVAEPEINALQEKKATLQKEWATHQEDFLTSKDWTLHDVERKYPGLLRAAYNRWNVGEYWPQPELTDPVDQFDPVKFKEQIQNGEVPTAILGIPRENLEYTFPVMQPGPDGPIPNDFSWADNPVLPGTEEADAAWQEKWGHVWGKLNA